MPELTLVTGGNGFLALHIMQQLLRDGHPVRATLRDLAKAEHVRRTLGNPKQLSFVQADLLNDADWPTAMADVTHVMSVAAPVFVDSDGSAEQQRAAETGTVRILQAAAAAGVKRVVMTANFGAVGFSNHSSRPTTADDWTDPEEPGLSAYERSKLLAERAAWQFATTHQLDLATVAAGAMLGTPLDHHISGSFGLVNQLLDGRTRLIPNIEFVVSNVADVAAAHVAALFAPRAAGKRFLAVNGSMTLPEMAKLIRQQRPQLAATLPHHVLPSWLIYGLAPFSNAARNGKLFMTISHQVDTSLAQEMLAWRPQYSVAETVLMAADALTANRKADK